MIAQETSVKREGGAATPTSPGMRVAVTSAQSLVGEAVRKALSSRGLVAAVIGWPASREDPQPAREFAAIRPDSLLLMCDLEPASQLRAAQALTTQFPVGRLLLTATPQGPLWGAMVDSGVDAVLPTSATLDEVVLTLDAVLQGHPVMDSAVRYALVREWQVVRNERNVLIARMRSLTPRERTVLRLMYAGDAVRPIADLLGVSEATVRSQVKSVLRKLDVNSQLAAVAAFGWLQDDLEQGNTWAGR